MINLRIIIERKAYQRLINNYPPEFFLMVVGIKEGMFPLQLAQKYGGGKVLLGAQILLAANYMTKTGLLSG